MNELKEEKLVQVANASLDIIRSFYRMRGDISESEMTKARMANTMFGAFVKYKQHQSNSDAVKVAVATQILDNPDDREAYLRLSTSNLKLKEFRESKLLSVGIKPESIEPVAYKVDANVGIAEPVKQE